ncbi:hypothetical protein SAY86_023344 [Trapa natans]|uniref:Uncharacterized protein n=1 Tax=Trapa natans TaxID=22666 RepID=A0AAN7LVM4_TRANT|nr:hypothetical protein SAY86_023344 [Trapa natans]
MGSKDGCYWSKYQAHLRYDVVFPYVTDSRDFDRENGEAAGEDEGRGVCPVAVPAEDYERAVEGPAI